MRHTMKKTIYHITSLALIIVLAASLSYCANVESDVHDMNGSIYVRQVDVEITVTGYTKEN